MKPSLNHTIIAAGMAAALAACSPGDRTGQAPGGYAGSAACLACHAKRDAELVRCWQASRHHKTLTILRDAEQAAHEFGLPPHEAREAFAVIGSAGGPRVALGRDFIVIASLGWQDEDMFGPPHEVLTGTAWRGIDAAESCLGCHSTGYSVSRRAVVEAGVGCEACHGPGGRHIDSAAGTCETVNPARLDLHRANMVCGQCHSQGIDKTGKYPFPVKPTEQALMPFIPRRRPDGVLHRCGANAQRPGLGVFAADPGSRTLRGPALHRLP
ncbi:MAG TPA: multiheme c-type cytochrome [Planctomycetota bacterium]|nr:multiheme c-type cytochrome [Planctomycetota bacterium]